MTKIHRAVATQLDEATKKKFENICKEQGCKPYQVLKDYVEQYIESYEGIKKDESGKGKEGNPTGTGQTKDKSGNNQGHSRESHIGQDRPPPGRDLDPERELIEVTA